MEPWTWIGIAAAILIAAIVLFDGYRRHTAHAGRGDDEKQLRDARRWQAIESERAREAQRRAADRRH